METPTSTPARPNGSLDDLLARAVGAESLIVPIETTPDPLPYEAWTPAMDVKETDREYVVFVDLPGMDEDDLDVAVSPVDLCVRGVREFDHDAEDAEEYIRLDRLYGPFCGSVEFALPVDPDGITAKYKRGVLKGRVPKRSEGRRLSIHVEV